MACTGRTQVEGVKTISVIIFAVVFVVAAIVAPLLLQPIAPVLEGEGGGKRFERISARAIRSNVMFE